MIDIRKALCMTGYIDGGHFCKYIYLLMMTMTEPCRMYVVYSIPIHKIALKLILTFLDRHKKDIGAERMMKQQKLNWYVCVHGRRGPPFYNDYPSVAGVEPTENVPKSPSE